MRTCQACGIDHSIDGDDYRPDWAPARYAENLKRFLLRKADREGLFEMCWEIREMVDKS